MNVLSLFDGMSCGKLALDKANIHVNKYFASEIDKWAIQISKNNNPDIVHLGNIENWKEWKLPKIDLIIGGSPCQGFSNAGKGLNFDDPRSKLFFVFVEILNFYKPKYFLLENVKMKKEWQDIITEYLGVEPIEINSALVSAQSRKRLYWTNIPNVIQPEDKKIYLKDIIETGEVDRDKSYCIDANYYKGGSVKNYLEKSRRQIDYLPAEKNKNAFHQSEKRLMVRERFIKDYSDTTERVGTAQDISGHDYLRRVYSVNGKSNTLCTGGGGNIEPKIETGEFTYRKLTPLECERLQTVPDNYTDGVSKTQRYKMLGNGWTVDVIAHIFSFME